MTFQKNKFFISFFAILIIFILGFESAAHSKTFELRKVSDTNALCNNGKVANYWLAKQETDKWLIQLEGGGSGWPAKYFKDRDSYLKSPAGKKSISDSAIAKQFYELGYNVIWIHYCSSDLYGGNHMNSMGSKDNARDRWKLFQLTAIRETHQSSQEQIGSHKKNNRTQ